MNNFKKYLPSKQFVFNILVIIFLILIFFLIRWGIFAIKNKDGYKETAVIPVTVGNVIQKDSNSNGIEDWEEYIWGLDPKKNGPENKEFILNKKKSLGQSTSIKAEDDASAITQNQALSRQFFATIMSLQQTGDLDKDAINSISEAIGQEIKDEPIPDIYTKDMMSIRGDTKEAKALYYNSFIALNDRYLDSDIGSEMTIIAQGIVNNDPQAIYSAKTISVAYREFGKDLIKIPTPSSAVSINLSLANNYEKVAKSIDGLTQVLSDPIIGMRSLLNYKKYTDLLISDIEKLKIVLQ
jgi:hypothetical protein